MPSTVATQVTFRGIAHSNALEETIHDRVAWLRQYDEEITGCHVTIERPHRHQHEGQTFRVRIEIGVPGGPGLVVEREQPARADIKDQTAYRDAYALVRDAFDAARRRLQDFSREQRGFVKAHSR